MSGGSGFHPSPEQLQAIIDTGIWWNHKVQELRDAERFEDAYALLQEFDVITSRSLEGSCLLYTSPSPRDVEESRMPSSA